MPLALDLISTLESGWILPVATTTRAKSPRSTEAIFEGSMVRLGLSAALTPYPPPPSTTTAIAPQMMRRRFLPFLPFFPFPKALPLLDIPDPRCLSLAATREYATGWEMFPCTASLDVGQGSSSCPAPTPFPARGHLNRGKKGPTLIEVRKGTFLRRFDTPQSFPLA